MTPHHNVERLRRLFLEGFSVADLAEPLPSFDAGSPASDVRKTSFPVVGIREGGFLSGYAITSDLSEGKLGDSALLPTDEDIVEESDTIPLLIEKIGDRNWLLVRSLGVFSGLIRRSDLEKPAMRMWLFGLVTIMEMNQTWGIEALFPGESWIENLSEGRIEKARGLQAERIRRGQDCRLLDCLQISDRITILTADPEASELLGFTSRRELKRAVKAIESLRNHLAHAQDITTHDWPAIREMAPLMDKALRREGIIRLISRKKEKAES